MKRVARAEAVAGPLAEFSVGQRVNTREGYVGTITDIHEGPADLTTYWVTLDEGMGGGEYAEGEIWPAGSNTTAAVERTAAEDYPELGEILETRLPPQIVSTAGVEVPGTCTTCGKAIKIEKGVLTHADGSNEHQVQPSEDARVPIGIASSRYDDSFIPPAWTSEAEENPEYDDDLNHPMLYRPIPPEVDPALHEAAQKIALTIDLKPMDRDDPEIDDPEEKRGWEDGLADGKAGVTRNFQDDSPGYRAGYDRGWARGVEIGRSPGQLDSDWDDTLESQQVAGTDPHLASWIGDFIRGDDSKWRDTTFTGPSHTFDWCRFRRSGFCFYSKNLNVSASEQAGYAVWIPENRGSCWRGHWEAQQACEMAQPGPNVPGGFTDATVGWEQGGQRGGTPSGLYTSPPERRTNPNVPTHPPPPYPPPRRSSLEITGTLDPSLAFHMTAAWRDVQAKAKRIRSEGGVRIVASKDGIVVGHIKGDTNVYETELVAVPGRRSVGQWHCGCKWSAYSWGRSGPWKRYEGRMCSHALALSYEAQARGMFGRDLTLDESQPSWMDPTIPVRRPGDYDRNKGRYSSLRPVEAQDDDEVPLKTMVAALLSEGTRYADIRAFALACGVPDVPALVREARRTKSFPAKVRGLIRRLFVENGQVFDEQTNKEIAARDVLFPGWDPRKGLNYRPPRQGAQQGGCACGGGSCGCGSMRHVASPATDLARATTAEEAAEILLTIARQREPQVTRMMQGLAGRLGGKMFGLDFRLKSRDSLVRKLKGEASRFPSMAAAALGCRDPLRYTFLFHPQVYTESSKRVIEELKRQGYGTVVANYWQRNDPYNGINVALTSRDGFPIELQFHTDESIRIKEEEVHPIYDKWRVETDEFKRAKMSHQMRDKFDMAHRPPGVLGIGELRKRPITPWKNVDWLHGRVLTGAVGQPGPYRFLLVEDNNTLIRVDTDDATVEEWAGDGWVVNLDLGRYIFMGEPGSEEIDEQDAHLVMSGWGMEPSYNFNDSFEWAKGPNSTDVMPTFPRTSVLDDDPEAALPVAYGDDDDEDDLTRAARLIEAAVVDDAIEMINTAYAAGEVEESSVTWYAPDAAGQSHAQADLGQTGVESHHTFAGLGEDEWLLDHETVTIPDPAGGSGVEATYKEPEATYNHQTAGQATAAFYTEQELREIGQQVADARGMSASEVLAADNAALEVEAMGVAACPRCGNPVNDGSDLVMVAGEGLIHKQCPTPEEAETGERKEPGEEPMPEETEQQKASRLMEQFKAHQRDPRIPNPFDHSTAESKAQGDEEIRRAAKEALKSFTPAEQQQYISEGEEEGVTASNLDRLDISGTHYEALDLTRAQAEHLNEALEDWGDDTI